MLAKLKYVALYFFNDDVHVASTFQLTCLNLTTKVTISGNVATGCCIQIQNGRAQLNSISIGRNVSEILRNF